VFVRLADFNLQPRGARHFDLWKWNKNVPSSIGALGVELQTRIAALATEHMVETAAMAAEFVSNSGNLLLELVYGHYKLAEHEQWLEYWGVPSGLGRDQLLGQLRRADISVADDLYCCIFIDPTWDPEHKLWLTLADDRIVDVNGEDYSLVGDTLTLG
jgi:hypothetical protein